MLVLTRKLEETIKIGSDITVKVIRLERGLVKLGIEAPAHIRILRGELCESTIAAAAMAPTNEIPSTRTEAVSDSIVSPTTSHKFLMEFESGYVADLEDQLLLSTAS